MKISYQEFIAAHTEEMYTLLREICLIPAPSYHEDERAAYCKKYFESIGAKDAYIDEAKNVVLPIGCEGSNEITPMPYREENGRIYCPGVGDDAASLVHLMLTAKFFIQNDLRPKGGVLFVCNSCEEGLGNLLGTRTVMKNYEGRVKQFLSLDCFSFDVIDTECVGSHRYEVEVQTAGGHSFGAFGNQSAVLTLAEMITQIYAIEVPKKPGRKTTYNVGIIEGGTSVNTIPQSAKMLCEYRSDDVECLAVMKGKFEEIFRAANTDRSKVTVKMIGERPCANGVDPAALTAMVNACKKVIFEVTGKNPVDKSSSTDCNIPLSLGIPAVCIPTYEGRGAHTREEYLEKASLIPGLEIALKTITTLTEADK